MWRSTLDTGFVGSDCRTLDPNVVFLDGVGGIDGDLIVCDITVLHAEIVVFDIDVQEGQNELFLDHFPDDSCLLVAIELDDGIVDLDLLFHCDCQWLVLGGCTRHGYS